MALGSLYRRSSVCDCVCECRRRIVVVSFCSSLAVNGVFQTLLHEDKDPIYVASLLPAYIVVVAAAVWSFYLVGGSLKDVKACCVLRRNGYDL